MKRDGIQEVAARINAGYPKPSLVESMKPAINLSGRLRDRAEAGGRELYRRQ